MTTEAEVSATAALSQAAPPRDWHRWWGAWHVLFMATVMVCAVIALGGETLGWHQLGISANALAILAWYGWLVRYPPEHAVWHKPVRLLLYVGILWGLWFNAVLLDTVFLFMLFVLFPQAFLIMPLSSAISGVVALNGFVIIAMYRINPEWIATWLLMILGTTFGGILLGYFINAIIHQSLARQKLIDALHAARAELAQAEREAGILQERQRIARELHDTLTQGLVGILTLLEAAQQTTQAEQQAQYHNHAKVLARQHLQDARRWVWGLSAPTLMNSPSFEHALRHTMQTWANTHHITADFVAVGDDLPAHWQPAHEQALLRITQEALANCFKHAQAQRVVVTLTGIGDALMLDIHDDGCGFDHHTVHHGYGLRNMQARAQSIGAELSIESAPDEGTTIAIYLPLSHPSQDNQASQTAHRKG